MKLIDVYNKYKKEYNESDLKESDKVGDEVEIFTPKGEIMSFMVEKLYNENMNRVEVARHPEEILKLYVPEIVEKDSMMRVKIL